MTEETVVLICARSTQKYHTVGSIVMEGDCGHQVWVGTSAQEVLKVADRVLVVCLECAPENQEQWQPVPGWYDEMKQEGMT